MMPPRDVLAQYPADLAAGAWQYLADAGGLSGARLWRLRTSWDTWCLKAWPEPSTTLEPLTLGHRLMRRANDQGLTFVPRVVTSRHGSTFVECQGLFWDIVSWQPGTVPARFDDRHLAAAGRALARIHVAAQDLGASRGPCPGLLRRLDALMAWDANRSGQEGADPLLASLSRSVRRLAPSLGRELRPWRATAFSLHGCLCDVRRDHVLFTDDEVTGLIDFGSAKIDHPTTDLARYLGDILDGNVARWQPLLDAYDRIRPLSREERDLLSLLERSGVVVSAMHWLSLSPLEFRPLLRQRWLRLAERLDAME